MGGSRSDCLDKVGVSGAFGLGAGGLWGAAEAAWSQKPAPDVKSYPHFTQSMRTVGSRAALLGAVAAAFTAGECLAGQIVGNDWRRNVVGSTAAGFVFGAHAGNMRGGLVAALSLSAITVVADAMGGTIFQRPEKREGHKDWTRAFPDVYGENAQK